MGNNLSETPESLYKDLYDFAPSAYLSLSRDGNILELNFSAAEMLGKERSELINKQFKFFLSEEKKPIFKRFLEQIFTDSKKQNCEITIITGDHLPTPVNIYGKVHQNNKFCLLTLVDLSEQKKAEHDLRENETRFRSLFENAPLSYQSLNQEGCLIDINPKWLKTLGYNRNEVIGKWFGDFLHPDYVEHFRKNFQKFKKRGFVSDFQFKMIKKDGSNIYVSFEGCAGYETDGSFKQMYCVFQDITKRKQAEKALKESEKKYQDIFNNSTIGIYRSTPEGEYKIVNKAFAGILGFDSPEQLINEVKDIRTLYESPEDRELIKKELKDKGFVENYEVLRKNRNNKMVWISITANQKQNPDRSIYYEGIIQDITKRKQAEEALKESEKKYKRLINNSTSLIMEVDVNTYEILVCNEEMAKRLDKNAKPNDLIGKNIRTVLPPDIVQKRIKCGEKAVLENKVLHFEDERNGRYFSNNYIPHITENNSSVQIVSHDITDIKKAEQALKESEAILKDAQKIAHIGNWLLELKTGKVKMSDEMLNILGMNIKNKIFDFKEMEKYWVSEDWLKINDALEHAIKTGESYEIETEISPKNKNPKYVIAKGVPVFDDDGKIIALKGTLQDITEEKKQRKEKQHMLEQLNHKGKMDAIGQISSGLAHDFNNILTGITGSVSLLKLNEKNLSEKGNRLIEIIMKSTERASLLINKLLLFSRKRGLIKQSCLIQPIIDDTVKMMKSSLDKKISLISVNNEKNLYVYGDSYSLQNTLMNLCINSAQAIQGEGKISISTERVFLDESYCQHSPFEIYPGNYIMIKVADNGSGIPEEHLNNIFDPFFTTKETGKGTGLGLSTVYGIVKEHSGEVKVESTVDRGSVFYIYLPEADQLNEKSTEPGSNEHEIIPGKWTVLLVDDEEFNRTLGHDLLESLGYDVLTASNGAEAYEIYKEKEVDIVLLDYMMPIMNGKEAFNRIKAIDKDCKVILMTGYAENEDIIEMRAMGLNGELHKPYSRSELSEILSSNRLL